MDRVPVRQTLVRRIPRALLVALALALIGGGAIGFATAAGEDGTTFSVPAPMGGDKAVYDVLPAEDDWRRQARIEVRAQAPLVLDDGRVVSAFGLRQGRDVASVGIGDDTQVIVGWSEAFVDAATGETVAYAQAGGGSAGSSSGSLLFFGGEEETYLTATSYREYHAQPVPCATRSGLQGRAVAMGGVVQVDGCGEGDADPFRVVGIVDLDGHPSLLVESRRLAIRLWYQPGIPYPVQFVFDAGSPDAETWRMTGFTAGLDPLVAGPVPGPVDLPAIRVEQASRFGPALDGHDHPFTVEQAVLMAQERSQQVTDFMAGHADWFVRSAEYEQEERDGAVQGLWTLELRGGADALRVLVRQPTPGETQAPAAVDRAVDSLPLDEIPGDQPGGNAVSVREAMREEPAWPAACRPDGLPTVSSIAQRWAALERRATTDANSYGFSLTCFDPGSGDVDPSARAWAGDARMVYPDSPDGPGLPAQGEGRTEFVLTMLRVDGAGHVVDLATSDVVVTKATWGAFGEPAAQGDPAAIQRSGVGAWARPSGPVAASITLVSALAALLYWLWPALKAGPLALFTRLEAPDLLDHPLRKELAQRIEAQPGVHYQDLVRAMGKGKGTIEHHLRKLEDAGLVKSIPAGGYTCFFPAAYDRRLTAAAPALKSAGARAVLAAIRANPGASALQVGAATGLSPAAIHHHLRRLGEAGLVDVLRNGRSLCLQPTALAGQVALGEPAAA